MLTRVIPDRDEGKTVAARFGVDLLPDAEAIASYYSDGTLAGFLSLRPSILVEDLVLAAPGTIPGRLTADALSYYALGYGRNARILGPDGQPIPVRNAVFRVDRSNSSIIRFLKEKGVEFDEESMVGRIWVP